VVERDGEQVAALIYDTSLDDDPELVEAIGGAAAIALENAQLRAEAQARLAERHASQRRIITASDTERRRRSCPRLGVAGA
jgi:GAF domain-containing protein